MLRRIFNLIGEEEREESQPQPRRTPGETPAPMTRRVLMIVQDPQMSDGRTLRETLGWNDPHELAGWYTGDVRKASYGTVIYEIVEKLHDRDFPQKVDGFRYTPDQFLQAWQSRQGFHQPDALDYPHLIDRFNLVERINSGEIDEVWLFGFPYAGYYESIMVGPGAFWCNAPGLEDRRFQRKFVIMGFSYERGVGEMLENLGHRTESIMAHVYRNHRGKRNLWERYIRYEKTHPGRAECGNVHFAPNSDKDYDWGNKRPVMSYADNWLDFPNIDGPPREMTCLDWGNGHIRGHHMWWFERLPHITGETDRVSNHWWSYVIDPNLVR